MSQETMSTETMFAAQTERLSQAPVENDVSDDVTMSKRKAAFLKSINEIHTVHVASHTHFYNDTHDFPKHFDVDECDALLYLLADQPNEPQYTANATETRSGSVRISDDA